ncbi:MAG: cob(I)yrinic acid a,c-diamide adenosyltransferase [Chloroflexota bacterium]|nr:cob(I)yrinic acid a,c-diamide adenosyltransferase [Chloroflexota bacterium]
MQVYTRTGDNGETSLCNGQRVPKDAPRVAAYGTVDELIACLGMACAAGLDDESNVLLQHIQRDLMTMAADLATPPESACLLKRCLEDHDVLALEVAIDGLEQMLAPLGSFVLAGGHLTAAVLHLARTVCRRTERLVVPLARAGETRWENVHYLNRLSDMLFVLSRVVNQRNGRTEVIR